MTTLFGDCLGPVGARLPHEKCPGRVTWPRPAECSCPCHRKVA